MVLVSANDQERVEEEKGPVSLLDPELATLAPWSGAGLPSIKFSAGRSSV
jgi:hypothetical protein